MKNGIIMGVMACSIAVLLFLLIKWNCTKSSPDIVAVVDSVQYYRNKLNQEVAAIKQREQDYYKAPPGYLDSIAKLHNTVTNLLQEVEALRLRGSVKLATGSHPEIIYRYKGSPVIDTMPGGHDPGDSAISVTQTFSNPYYSAVANISLHGDSSYLWIESYDTLRVVAKLVKEGHLFNRQTYLQVDAVNTNPYNRIQGLSVYRKPLPKPKKIGIGIQVGYGFSNSLTPSIYVGVGISYNILRL
ncbi:MAG TPA: hypothetical protein VK666_20200 [Chryseolinea sp.]|nr:hypothetical protein [Chryseolinea sp.]